MPWSFFIIIAQPILDCLNCKMHCYCAKVIVCVIANQNSGLIMLSYNKCQVFLVIFCNHALVLRLCSSCHSKLHHESICVGVNQHFRINLLVFSQLDCCLIGWIFLAIRSTCSQKYSAYVITYCSLSVDVRISPCESAMFTYSAFLMIAWNPLLLPF